MVSVPATEPSVAGPSDVNPDLSCSASTNAAAITASDATSDGPATDGSVAGTDTIPPSPGSTSDSLSLSLIIGVSIGAVVLVAAVLAVLVKRSRKKAEPTAPKRDEADHVAEQSSTDIVEVATTAKSEEMQCADTVHAMEVVVEEAGPKESETVSV